MNRIIRVFPHRNSFTPTDDMAFFEDPGLFTPEHDAVHVCCVFTWDIERCRELQFQWQGQTNKPVELDGPAFGNSGGDFIPGMYTRQGVTITSRGCPNNCSFCLVPKREGKLRELPIIPGNIMNANNFLAESKPHRRLAYDMLKKQKTIEFKGGLEAVRLTDWDIEEMRGLSIKQLFLACDTPGTLPLITKTCKRLIRAGFTQRQIRCYVLIGNDQEENLSRLINLYMAGALPFAQLYQPPELTKKVYSKDWERLARTWSRPAGAITFMKEYMARALFVAN